MKITRTRVAVAAVLLFIAGVFILFDWNWLRGPIERYVLEKTGRRLEIGGDIRVKLGLPPEIHLGKVRYENPDWAKERQMAAVEDLAFTPEIISLLRRPIVITHLRLTQPDVNFERTKDGRRNWVFGKSDDPNAQGAEIRSLTIDRGVIVLTDAQKDLDAKFEVRTHDTDTAPAGAASEAAAGLTKPPSKLPTHVTFTGQYKRTPFRGAADTGDILGMSNSGISFPIKGSAKVGETHWEVDGAVADLAQLSGIDARVKISGPDWSQLYPILPIPLPASPPFTLAGHVVTKGKGFYAYEGFKGVIGSSDVTGDLEFTQREPRSHLSLALKSRVLDLKDLGPMIGVTAQTKAAVGSKSPAARVLPDAKFRTDRMLVIDANVTLNAKEIRRPEALALEDLSARLKLKDGVMTLEPLDFGFAGGNIVSTISMDANKDPIATRATIKLRSLRLEKLFPTVALMKDSQGRIGGQMQLHGTGNNVAAILGSASGEAGFAVTGGELSNLLMEFIGLDGGEIVKFLLGGDRKTGIRCGVAAFELKDGMANARTLVFDTQDTEIDGSGYVSLREEKLDLVLSPHPKDKSILVLRSPIHIKGTLAHPSFKVDRGGILKRGGTAIALGLLNPLAALIPLIETGSGKDSDCTTLLQQVDGPRREAEKPPTRQKSKDPRSAAVSKKPGT